MKEYLEKYYFLMHQYYNINKLKINPDKTLLLLVYKNKFINNLKDFSFKADQHLIKPKKILKF